MKLKVEELKQLIKEEIQGSTDPIEQILREFESSEQDTHDNEVVVYKLRNFLKTLNPLQVGYDPVRSIIAEFNASEQDTHDNEMVVYHLRKLVKGN